MKASFYKAGGFEAKSHPLPWEGSFEEFCQNLAHKEHPGPREIVPAFSPVEFIPHTRRALSNVIAVHAVVADLDDIPLQDLPNILDRIETLDSLLYTTWSYKPGPTLRARIVVNLSRPVPADSWPAYWPVAMAALGCPTTADKQCKDASRFYFGPFIPIGSIHPAQLRFRGQPLTPPDVIPISTPVPIQTISRNQLRDLSTSWQRSKNPTRKSLGQALAAVAQGEPFAEPGERDDTLFRLSRELVKAWEGAPLDTKALAALFGPSLQVMAWPEATLEFVQAKFDRAYRDAPLAQAQNIQIKEAWGTSRATPYTPEELAEFGPMQKRWVIQKDKSYYVHGPRGYRGPYTASDAFSGMSRDLAPAVTAGVSLSRINATGDLVPMSLTEVVNKYGAVAHRVIVDLSAPKPYYDPTVNETKVETFVEAPTPLRLLPPQYDLEIHHWLQTMAGPKYVELCKWLSFVPDVNLPLPALVLTGPPGAGKTLFAHALSALWGRPPCTLDQALSTFNDGLLQSPIVFGDERLPKDAKGHSKTEDLREFIGNRNRALKRKFLPDAIILGCPRVIIAANNPEILGFNQDLTADDMAAISERFLHIKVHANTRAVLETIPEPSTIATQDRLAKHALWLWINSTHKPEGRFSVVSDSAEMLRTMTVSGGLRAMVCQWLVAYLLNPKAFPSKLIMVRNGELLVNVGIFATPNVWLGITQDPPKISLVSRALTTICKPTRPKVEGYNYRVIDTANLVAWAEATDMVSREAILTALCQDTPAPVVPVANVVPFRR